MKNTLLNWLAIATLFIGSIAVVINRYTQTTETESKTTEGLSVIGLMIVMFIAVFAVAFIVTNVKGYIQNHSFGRVSVTVYSALFAFIVYCVYLLVLTIKNTAEANIDAFSANMEYHLQSLWYIIMVAMVALIICWLDIVIEFIKKTGKIINDKI